MKYAPLVHNSVSESHWNDGKNINAVHSLYLKYRYLKVPSFITEYNLDTFAIFFPFQLLLSQTTGIS